MSFLSTVTASLNGAGELVRTYNNIRNYFDTSPDVFNKSDPGTFSKSGLSVEEYKREILKTKANLEKLQHADVFKVVISRAEPYYDTKKSEIITSMMKSISITHDGIETQEDRIGSGYINRQKAIQSGEIQAVFHEFQDGSVLDFLTKISPLNSLEGTYDDINIGASLRGVATKIEKGINLFNETNAVLGSPIKPLSNIGATLNNAIGGVLGSGGGAYGNKNGKILPSDGTSLLPYEYYFKIKVITMDIDLVNNRVGETVIVDDDFVLEGSISQDFATGTEEYEEITATFKPIKSWR